MKKIFKSFMLIATAAVAFASCQKEQETPEVKDTVKLIISANVDNLASDNTKTYIDEENKVFWGEDEYMTAALVSGGSFATYNSNDNSADVWDGENEAYFEFDVELKAGQSYTYGGFYPSSAAAPGTNNDPSAYKVVLPASQTASADSYDPAAYLMIAKPESFESTTTEWTTSFRRLTALNKITLSNINDQIVKVEITAPTGKYLAGRRKINLTTGESGEIYSSGSETETVTVNFGTALDGSSFDAWFASWGVNLTEGDPLKIVAYSKTYKYTRTIYARAAGISFKEGFLNKLSINMATAEKEALESYAGTYSIYAYVSSNETYFALGATNNNNSTRLDAVASEYNGGQYSVEEPFAVTDASLVWNIVEAGNGQYNIKNGTKYLSYSGTSGTAKIDGSAYALTITKQDNGTFQIASVAASTMLLSKNNTSAYFGFYGNTQNDDLYLVPTALLSKLETPVIAFDSETKTVSITAEDGATIYYTTDNTDPSGLDSELYTDEFTISQTTIVKAIAKKAGSIDSDIQREECVVEDASTTKYKKVTVAPSNWEGQYLIVWGEEAHATVNGKDLAKTCEVTIADNAIVSTQTTDAAAVTIEEGNNSTYSILLPSGKYLGFADKSCSSSDTKVYYSISLESDGTVSISGNINGTAKYLYNQQTYYRFYSANGSYTKPTLYKLEDNRQDQTLSFTPSEVTYDIYDHSSFATPVLSGAKTTVTYSSSNPSIADVDSEGNLTIKKVSPVAGITITATAAADATYKSAQAFYTLKVVDSTPKTDLSEPSNLQWNAETKELSWDDTNTDKGTHGTNYKYQYSVGDEDHYADASSATGQTLKITSTQTVYVKAVAITTETHNSSTSVSKECTVASSGDPVGTKYLNIDFSDFTTWSTTGNTSLTTNGVTIRCNNARMYGQVGCIKVGYGTAANNVVTLPALSGMKDEKCNVTLTFKAVSSVDNYTMTVTASTGTVGKLSPAAITKHTSGINSGATTASELTKAFAASTASFSVTITDATPSTSITISAGSAKQWFLDDIVVTKTN